MVENNRQSKRSSAIELIKRTVKAELEQVQQASGDAGRLSFILERIEELESTSEQGDMLRRFVYIMSALVHHERYGGLKPKQIQDLAVLGQALLRVLGVKTGHSPISFLHAELHSILSDIHYSQGEFLPALWERQLAAHLAVMPAEHEARQQLGMGICAMRLGSMQAAIQYFQKGLETTQESHVRDKLRLHLLKAQRLMGEVTVARTSLSQLEGLIEDEACRQELAWEKICLDLQEDGDLKEFFSLTRKGRLLYSPSYLLELFFWSYAHPKTQWMQRIPRLSTWVSTKGLVFNRYSALFSLAQNLEQAYDTDIPFSKRLFDIKKNVPKISLLGSIDQELLVWMGLTRWLYRSHYYGMARITFYEYESLSLKISGGSSKDVLSLANDLLQIDWHQKTA